MLIKSLFASQPSNLNRTSATRFAGTNSNKITPTSTVPTPKNVKPESNSNWSFLKPSSLSSLGNVLEEMKGALSDMFAPENDQETPKEVSKENNSKPKEKEE